MPSRKQRRRRAKELRHEYEYVYVDEEGREVEVDPAELRPEPAKPKSNGRTARATTPRKSGAARGTRPVQPPSWRRVWRRGAIVGPLMFLFISFLSAKLTLSARIAQTVVMLALFLPFSYLMDRTVYRAYLRRTGARGPSSSRRR